MTDKKILDNEEIKVNLASIVALVMCILTWGVSFVSRNVWNSAIASESTMDALGITAVQAGGIATAFYIGYVASNFFSGYLVDAIGAKKSLAITALGTGIATLLIPLANGYWIIFLLRVLAGIFAGPLFSCIMKFNYAYFPNRLRAVVVGMMGAGPAVGGAIASIWFTPMVAEKGYQITFYLAGIITFVVGVIVWIFLKDRGLTMPMKKMDMLSEEEKKRSTKNAIKVFMQKDFLIGSVTHFLLLCAGTGVTTWMLALLVNDKGLTPLEAGLVFGLTQLTGLISGTIGGIVSDLLKTRKWLLVGASIATFVLYLMFVQASSIRALTIIYTLIRLVGSFTGTPSNTMQSERAKGPYSGKVMGWYNAVCQLGSVVMPVVLGIVIDITASYAAVIYTVASLYILIAILGLLVKDTYVRRVPAAESRQ